MDRKAINEFALKYYELFDNPDTKGYELDTDFGDECFSLNFEMDLGKSFVKRFSFESIHDVSVFNEIKNSDEDIIFLGTTIFSYWRYITHWTQDSLLSDNNCKWFKVALKRLAEITEE